MNGAGSAGLDDFDGLVRQVGPSLLRFARHLAGDEATAEDLVQETFLRAWRARSTFRGDAAPLTWLRRILHHAAIDRIRRTAREELVDDAEALWRDDSYTVDVTSVVEQALDREALQDAIVHLPWTYRSAVLLHDVEGWTAAEIAEATGIGVPLAKQRIRRGRMALVTHLAGQPARRSPPSGSGLRCWEARSRVSGYLDGDLTDEDRAAVEAHLAVCPTCPPLYAGLVGTRDALSGLRDPDTVVPAALAARISARLAAERAPSATGTSRGDRASGAG